MPLAQPVDVAIKVPWRAWTPCSTESRDTRPASPIRACEHVPFLFGVARYTPLGWFLGMMKPKETAASEIKVRICFRDIAMVSSGWKP